MATGVPNGSISGAGAPRGPGDTGPLPSQPSGGWTVGRVVSLVIGSLLAIVSLALLGGGGTMLWADQSLRSGGYVTSGPATYSTTGYALASESVNLHWSLLLTGLVGDVRVRVTATNPDSPVFVAIGPADRVQAYLSGTSYATVTGGGATAMTSHHGTARPVPPQTAGIWVARAAGTGTQVLRWTAQDGNWAAVAMNPDGSPGVSVRADAGVSAPELRWLALKVIMGGFLLGVLSAALIWVPVRLASGAR
jgi:hypothetical protein